MNPVFSLIIYIEHMGIEPVNPTHPPFLLLPLSNELSPFRIIVHKSTLYAFRGRLSCYLNKASITITLSKNPLYSLYFSPFVVIRTFWITYLAGSFSSKSPCLFVKTL